MLIFSRDRNCSVSVVAVSAFSVLSCIPRDLLSLAAIGLVNIDMFGNTFFDINITLISIHSRFFS